MFENLNTKTELIIVSDGKCKKYAEYLQALLGQRDDVDGKVVGTKDDSVNAAIYTVQNYKDTLPKITSNTHILFIGKFKEAKDQAKNMDDKFNKYGMHYGWLGKRAVMYVDGKMLNKDEYEQFFEFSQKYQKKFEKVTFNFINSIPKTVKGVGLALPLGFTQIVAAGAIATDEVVHMQINDQQYRCLTMALYLDGLQKFLEE